MRSKQAGLGVSIVIEWDNARVSELARAPCIDMNRSSTTRTAGPSGRPAPHLTTDHLGDTLQAVRKARFGKAGDLSTPTRAVSSAPPFYE
jgi:hypothetical protein